MDDSDDCTTCGVFISRKKRRKRPLLSCLIRRERLKKICPCRLCIVKTTCYFSSEECDDHMKVYDYARERKWKRLEKTNER